MPLNHYLLDCKVEQITLAQVVTNGGENEDWDSQRDLRRDVVCVFWEGLTCVRVKANLGLLH